MGDGDCFDTVSCFSRGSIPAIDLDKCTVATPAAGTGLNVAIVLPSGGPGICGREACYVPLLPSKDAGWTESGGRITVPPATCARIKTGAALGVAVTTACRTRSESVPTCGPWSSVTSEPGTKDAGPPDGVVAPEAGPDAGVDAADASDVGDAADAADGG